MRNLTKILVSTTALTLAISSRAAYAQDTQTTDEQSDTLDTQAILQEDAQAAESTAIVVTGSRIARPNLESTVPITSVNGAEIFETGSNSDRRPTERASRTAQHVQSGKLKPVSWHDGPQPA